MSKDARHEVSVQEIGVGLESVRVVMRNYLSTQFLWAAGRMARRAQESEDAHAGRDRFDIEHRAYVLGAVTSAATFLEAAVNELFQDSTDGHGLTDDGYLAPLPQAAQQRMAQIWRATGGGRGVSVVERYQLLLTAAGARELDRGGQPYQDATLLTGLRNHLAHFQPEDVSTDVAHVLERRLRAKFPDNAMMRGNPWWPDRCLGAGCAHWAVRTARALADHVSTTIGIQPNYLRLADHGWLGFGEP